MLGDSLTFIFRLSDLITTLTYSYGQLQSMAFSGAVKFAEYYHVQFQMHTAQGFMLSIQHYSYYEGMGQTRS